MLQKLKNKAVSISKNKAVVATAVTLAVVGSASAQDAATVPEDVQGVIDSTSAAWVGIKELAIGIILFFIVIRLIKRGAKG